MSILLGVLLAGGFTTALFLPTILRTLAPVIELTLWAMAEWLRALWHGVKTSNYGTWALVLTVAIIVAVSFKNPCTASYGPPRATLDTPIAKSSFIQNQGRGSVNYITKKEASWFETPRDIFCRYFGCI